MKNTDKYSGEAFIGCHIFYTSALCFGYCPLGRKDIAASVLNSVLLDGRVLVKLMEPQKVLMKTEKPCWF